MKRKATVLGCGLIGATMAKDLAADDDFTTVTVVDASERNLATVKDVSRITTRQADLSDPAQVRAAIADCDVVLGALPSRMGFATLRTVLEAGKPYCDISFMPQDALGLNDLARSKGVTAVVDCGVSPGLSNLCVGYARSRLDHADRAEILVGGMPKTRQWPYLYKAPFAPADVLEIYTRPARLVENGKTVVREALSEPELVDFPEVGTLEAFNTDGLRSLIDTLDIPNMKEKTLRYPGHRELMHALRETGLLDKSEVDVGGVKVRPLDLTSKLLFPMWRLEKDEEEFTIMRVTVEGQENGKRVSYTFDLYDQYDRSSATTSMARTTAFPCTIVARMLAEGRLNEPGVLPPESIAHRAGVFDHIVQQLDSRGVRLTLNRSRHA